MEYLNYTEKDILERVDEYTLYCFYLKYEPLINGKYPVPYRTDNDPSWGIFEAKTGYGSHEFVWKDQARGTAGNLFDLVRRLFGYETKRQAMLKVMADFGLGGKNEDKPIHLIPIDKKYADPVHIEIISRPFTNKDLQWWNLGNITEELLQRYTTKAIKCYWVAADQKEPSYPPGGTGFAYREWNLYQLYFPFSQDKSKKFRTNFNKEICVHGFQQLEFNQELCIITKSRKDVMCLRSFGYEAISPMSENTLVPEACMARLRKEYKRRLVLFDTDGKHRGEDYADPKIFIPDGPKDVFDYCKAFGPSRTAEMLKRLTG